MSGRRRGKGGGHEEHHVDERWLVSYADMITVLMALFIVLYAMSTVDAHKFDQLKNSLATGFGVTKTAKIDQSDAIVPKQFVKKDGAGFSNSTIAVQQVAKEITDELRAAGLQSKASVTAGTNEVTISLVGSSTYFEGNSDHLRPVALKVLTTLRPSLHDHAGEVTVEGHADPRGTAGEFGNDWALASARATAVLVWLVDHEAVKGQKVKAVSFGSEHADEADTRKAVEHNRRVDIVLHTVTVPTVPAVPADTKTASGAEDDTTAEAGRTSAESTEETGAATTEEHGEAAAPH